MIPKKCGFRAAAGIVRFETSVVGFNKDSLDVERRPTQHVPLGSMYHKYRHRYVCIYLSEYTHVRHSSVQCVYICMLYIYICFESF